MQKIVLRILIGIGIVVVLIGIIFTFYWIKSFSEIKKMKPIETGEILENIFSVRDGIVNVYLIKEDSNYIAIDAGNDPDVVAAELKKLKINPDRIVAILLTHTDRDHVASLSLFKNASVYLSDQEEKLLNGEESRFLFFGNRISAKEYSLIEDQQVFYIGKTSVKGILTPGHTFGSMCYLIDDEYLFIGDALSLKDGKIAGFNTLFNTNSENALKSMDKLLGIPTAKYIFTAHYGYSADYQNAVKDWGQ